MQGSDGSAVGLVVFVEAVGFGESGGEEDFVETRNLFWVS